MQKLWLVALSLGFSTTDLRYYREMDTRKLSEQTQLLNKLQNDYHAMKILVQSYEGSLKAVREEAKYVTNSRTYDMLLTPSKGAQRSCRSFGSRTFYYTPGRRRKD